MIINLPPCNLHICQHRGQNEVKPPTPTRVHPGYLGEVVNFETHPTFPFGFSAFSIKFPFSQNFLLRTFRYLGGWLIRAVLEMRRNP